ncbi:MAG: protoporphyrinogen oxidase [Thermoanaerobaculales bacterium]|jgi:oxygen-dependent protoporphyrinogen oxidase|nr:protoporphyrinogen oxidase [Thermoanaerobaculales bacterium]
MSPSIDTRVAIVGGGITGLAAASWLELDHGIDDAVVLEASDRAGGKIRSELEAGHTVEGGPQGFLDNAPDTLELARRVGLGGALVPAADASADRFILRAGRLRAVPTSPVSFATSDLLPLGGRLRVFAEPFARRRPDGDESVFDFAARRIGRVAAEVLVDSMVTGVFAGDSRRLSLAATFPRMAAMEAEHGSLTRALVARMRAARRSGGRSAGPAGPGGTLHTFDGGMELLPRRLADRLGDRLRSETAVLGIGRDPTGLILETGSGPVRARRVLLALPADRAARLLAGLAPDAAEPLAAIPTVPIAVVMASYADPGAFGRPVDGFGFLVPRAENAGILGTLYCHSIFPGQAPAPRLFLRTMIGGAREPGLAGLGDDALVGSVRAAHARILGRDPDPDRVWIVRWAEGISQYTIGHLDRVAAAERAARAAGIELAGSPYRGVSVNDCIRQARAAAGRLAATS